MQAERLPASAAIAGLRAVHQSMWQRCRPAQGFVPQVHCTAEQFNMSPSSLDIYCELHDAQRLTSAATNRGSIEVLQLLYEHKQREWGT